MKTENYVSEDLSQAVNFLREEKTMLAYYHCYYGDSHYLMGQYVNVTGVFQALYYAFYFTF